ncbi:hypothetical protein GGS23DRAFT_33883 [Durotheca rogersii]|uniref:uncharacterized protein n=1 Tax=Durotheca rogersii TaxID=419775 RepID=UPI00221FC0C1|nr:uncharacterized protein GGS23DRAFT_33883 [Durotheca rogersii]KAI5868499.1 hypothetical protein GGS23DRAFT_33883 [Durotheca rogersii]
MKGLGGILAEAYASWSQSIYQCCLPWTSDSADEKPRRHPAERGRIRHIVNDTDDNFYLPTRPVARDPLNIVYQAPPPVPPPSVTPFRPSTGASKSERASRRRRGSGRSSFSTKRLLRPSSAASSSRKLQISAPTNFRHLNSETFRVPQHALTQARPRPAFRPLELSIYMSQHQLSPILPRLDYPTPPVTPPPPALTPSSREGSPHVSHSRSYSSMSFHIPRRPVNGGSVFDSPRSDASTPQPPRPARARASTLPSTPNPMMEDLVERVATAMLERDRLQEQIDDVIERQSIYISSRPSTANGEPEMEPMPEIPALPPNAPSFSERVSSDRPRTAPPQAPGRTPYKANSSRKVEGRVPPPPLPLRLRPPLRKKKSFSRVSTWLFPSGEPRLDMNLESLTNEPKPVTGAEGFYQVTGPEPSRRYSFDSVSTGSGWTVEEEQTVPTSLSPSSTTTSKAKLEPRVMIASGLQVPVMLPKRQSVGVAI